MVNPSNIFAATLIAPFLCIFSALSLASLQRGLEWTASIAKLKQKGYLKNIQPFMKSFNNILERIFDGKKIEITSTNILLMGVILCLICLLFDHSEKPKAIRMVEKKNN